MEILLSLVAKCFRPFALIDDIATTIWPHVEPQLDAIDDDLFTLADKLFNLLASLTIHWISGSSSVSWAWFFQVLMMLGVVKQLMIMRRDKINTFKEQSTYESRPQPTTDNENQHSNAAGIHLDADKVEEFCLGNLKPTLDWLNKIVATFWMNFRAYTKFKFLNEIWPRVKASVEDTPLNRLEILDFNIGDKPFRVISIECLGHSEDELIVDLVLAYDGNANITITYSQESLNVSIPVTLQKFSISNVKVRVVFKHLMEHLPLFGGLQLFFLESPVIDWETADAAKVVDLPGLESLLKSAIENQIIRRFVLPNRLSIPFKLSPKMLAMLRAMPMKVVQVDDSKVAMPRPVGIVQVKVIKAEGLKPTDLSFRHLSKSKNVNPLHPSRFSCSEVLPKKSSSDPYVKVSIGRASHRSLTHKKTLNPEWDFECEFPVEYYHRAEVKLEIYDEDVNITGVTTDDLMGRISEKLQRIKDEGRLSGWYNCQIYQGRAYLDFRWIPLIATPPSATRPTDNATAGPNEESAAQAEEKQEGLAAPGVLCVLLGTFRSSELMRPTCYLEIGEEETTGSGKKEKPPASLKAVSLDAITNDTRWTFNEGHVFRIRDLRGRKPMYLKIKIYDNKSWKFVGERKFRMTRLLETPLSGTHKFSNPFNKKKPVDMSLHTMVLYDKSFFED